MKLQVLLATMNKTKGEIISIIQESNLHANVLIVNQCGRNASYTLCENNRELLVYETNEKGLSKSRNKALNESDGDICLIADDDILYVSELETIICNAFIENPEYDIIAFYVERSSDFNQKEIGKQHVIGRLQSLSLMSVQIALQRDKVLAKGISFDEHFGAGSSKYICGEENIFLMDCLKKGCRILYVPIKIASTSDTESTWFHGYNEQYFCSKGAVFYRLFPLLSMSMIFVFALTKRRIYQNDISLRNALRYMKCGRKECKKLMKESCG